MEQENQDTRYSFRPRARIMHTLGDELISNETVAVIELIKNSYDADATRVYVKFVGPIKDSSGSIEVVDNGHGMPESIVKTTWLEPATPIRKRHPRSIKLDRRVLGEKGIGRFAAARLGRKLELVTREAGSDMEVRAYVDWDQFDDDRFLDEVDVTVECRAPLDICGSGSLGIFQEEDRWDGSDLSVEVCPDHGTILRMIDLRTQWTDRQLEHVHTALSRLLVPIWQDAKGRFQVYLQFPDGYEQLSGLVRPPDLVANPHYTIAGDVDGSGSYSLRLKLKNSTEDLRLSGRFERDQKGEDEPIPFSCGPFTIEVRGWDREEKDLEGLARELDMSVAAVRTTLDRMSGISIYRDAFRVLPYGEPEDDWLRLDSRRVNNPTQCLSNNQVFGFIEIAADVNPGLRDQSNREGLVESPALSDLRTLALKVLNVLEKERYKLRPRRNGISEDESDRNDEGRTGVFTGFDLKAVSERIKERYPDDAETLSFIHKEEEHLQAKVREVQEVLARYHRLATLGLLIDTVLHEGRAPLGMMRNEAILGMRDIKNTTEADSSLAATMRGRLELIESQADVLSRVFKKIEPFGGRKRGRPSTITVERAIANAFAVLAGDVADVGAQIDLPSTHTEVTADQGEIQQVIVNLLQNSLHWLRHVPKTERRIVVSAYRSGPDQVDIEFSDSGPGVRSEDQDFIFDPYFTTKENGTGLGLTIAGEIVKDYYSGDLELVDSGPLGGATFHIALRRRI